MSLTYRDIVTPDLIIPPDEDARGPLDPCPSCDAVPHDSPEGVHDAHSLRKHPWKAGTDDEGNVVAERKLGDPKWDYPHCWKCGYRPGVNVTLSVNQLQRQFKEFVAWQNSQMDAIRAERASGINPPASSDEADELRRQLAEAQARENELRAQLNPPPEDHPDAQ